VPGTSTTRTQAQRRATTRGELLAAAERVIAERGYEAGSLSAIAEAAGVSKGALYHHFESKDELLFALLEERFQERIELGTRAGEQPDPDVPARMVEELPFDRPWNLLFLEFVLRAARDEPFRREFRKRLDHLRANSAVALERFWEANGIDFDLDATEAVLLIVALGNGLAIEALTDPRQATDPLYAAGMSLMYDGAVARTERLRKARGRKSRPS
jgi:AcrR family transcriptional regulator